MAFLHLVTPESTLALCLGPILNNKITNKKHKNANDMALNRPQKGHFFTVQELKQESRERVLLFDLKWARSTAYISNLFATLNGHMSVDDWGLQIILPSRQIHK